MEFGDSFEQVRALLPPYLSAEKKQALFDDIRRFPNVPLYSDQLDDPESLQGDGEAGLEIRQFETGNKRRVTGLILSNSCDLAAGNSPAQYAKVVFSPLVTVAGFTDRMRSGGKTDVQIQSALEVIKKQQNASVFYLPAHGPLPDCFAFLDEVYSQPMTSRTGVERVFRLSQVGFWIFTIKLSIHFCRVRENVVRD